MTGLDIAQEQIRIAEGMALTLRQDAIRASAARFDSRGRQAGFTAPPARARAIALR